MELLELAGSPTAIGEAFGELRRREIAELYEIRLRNALAQARRFGGREVSEAHLLALARACFSATSAYDPDGFAELRGIARAANISLHRVLALNGLSDLRDALAWGGELDAFGGCTWLIVAGDRSATGEVICGQTWDLGTDNQPFVVALHRRPNDAPESWTVTTAGCLSLMGMNSAGVAIGTSNLRTLDARPGVPYLSLIHRGLACTNHDDAVAAIEAAPRAGAHAYFVVDASGRASAIECSAEKASVSAIASGVHVHTNHCQVPAHVEIEGDVPRESSEARRARMGALLDAAGPKLEPADLQRFLADTAGGELAICRDDFDGISTNAAIVMTPSRPSALACHGLPSTAQWIDLQPTLA
jgi:isopenicillin-N N-acyltransferase-like protein